MTHGLDALHLVDTLYLLGYPWSKARTHDPLPMTHDPKPMGKEERPTDPQDYNGRIPQVRDPWDPWNSS